MQNRISEDFSGSQSLQKFEVQSISPDSVTSTLVGDKYKQPSLPEYMLKNIKMMIFTFVSIAMLVITGALPKDWLPGNTKFWIMLAVTGVSAPLIYRNYHHEKEMKIEEKKEKLQQDVTRHYQPVAKNLADKLVQSLVSTLEVSERQMTKKLEIIEEQFAIHLVSLDKTQLEIKARTAQYSLEQRSLEAELQKLKRLL